VAVAASSLVTYLFGLTDTTSDFYATATAFKARVDVAVAWSKGAGATELAVTKLVEYQAGIDGSAPVDPTAPVVGTALTAAADDVKGTAGADTFTGVRSTLSTASTLTGTDKIDGAEGTDTLSVRLDAAFAGFTTGSVKNVEVISLTNTSDVARGFDATGVVGAATYNLDSKTGLNLTNADTLGTVNVLNRASGTTTVDFDDTKISTTTDNTLNLGVSALGAAGTFVTVTAPDIQKMTITSSGTSSWVDVAGAPLKSVTIKGASDLSLRATGVLTLTSVDASEATGKVTLANLVGTLSSVKGGSADDTVTVAAMTINPTLSGGAGADTLNLNALAAGTYQPSLTGFETLAVNNSAGEVIMSFTKSTDVANLVVDTLGGALTMSKAGAGALAITSKGAQGANTITNDTTGKVSFATVAADKTTVTTNDANALSVTASKTTSLNVDVAKFTNATGTFTAPLATEVSLNANGGFTGAIVVARATDLNITAAETVTLAATSNLSSVNSITATAAKNLTIDGVATSMDAIGSMTLAGTGSSSALNTGDLGAAANTQAISLTATGWKGGATIGTVNSQDSIKLDVSGTTGTVGIDVIGNNTATTPTGSVTINATGALGAVTTGNIFASAGKSITVSAKDGLAAVVLGDLAVTDTATGNNSGSITVDVSGSIAAAPVIGTLTAGTVTVDVSGGLNAVTPGVINALTATYTGNATTNTRTDTVNNLTFTGGSGVDNIAVAHQDTSAGTATVAAAANEESHALSISSGSGDDVLGFTMYTGQTKATYTGKVDLGESTGDADTLTFTGDAATTLMDLNGLTVTGADSATTITVEQATATTIQGTTGADLILAGGGADAVFAGTGDDIIRVTVAADMAVGEILNGGFGNDTLHLVEAAAYDLTNLAATADNLVGEAGIENLVVTHTAVTLDQAISGTALRINTAGAVTLQATVTMAAATTASTLDLSKLVFTASDTMPVVVETALAADDDNFVITGNAGANTITGTSLADAITGGIGNDTIILTAGGRDTVIFGGDAITSATAANKDTITGFAFGSTTGDVLQFGSTFLGSNTYTSGNLTSIASGTTNGMSANDGDILLVVGALTGASGSAAIATLVGSDSGFSVAGTQDVVIVAADGSNTYVWYVNDSLDGNVADVTSTDIVLIGVLSGTTATTGYDATNFAATIAA